MFISKNIRNQAVIIFIFIVLTVVLTFPLILKINTSCSGFSSTDELFAPIWTYWYWQYSLKHRLGFWVTDFLAYPFGDKVYGVFSPYVYVCLIALLSTLFNYIAVLNIQIISNFIFTGFFTYLLVYELTKSRLSGLLSGIIFTFCPQHFIRSWQHITLSYFQWMPLYLLSLFQLKRNPNVKQSILVALALFIVASFDLHYLFFMFIATILFIPFIFIYVRGNKLLRFIRYLTISGIFSFMLIIIQFYGYISKILFHDAGVSSVRNIFKRPFEDLFAQSARPLSYFLPSTEHPIFGGLTESFVGSPLYGDSLTEHNLYLGIVALVLAFFGLRLYRRQQTQNKYPNSEDFAIKFFLLLAIVAWFFSQPPWWNWFNVRVPMPAFFLYNFLPMIRAYCRFGILLVLCIAILAGFGLKYLLLRFKNQETKIIVAGLLCLLVIFDFWNNPWQHVMDLSQYPRVYDWLRKEDNNFVIAEYPLDIVGPNDFYKFFQTIHQKKMINGTIPETYPHKIAKTISKLSDANTTGVLRWMGVKYALVHREDYLKTELIEEREELDKIPKNSGLVLIRSFPAQECTQRDLLCVQKSGSVDVYELIAPPIEPKIE